METIPADLEDTVELPAFPYSLPDETDDDYLPLEPIETEPAQTACTWIYGHEAIERRDVNEHGREVISIECRFCGDPMPHADVRDEYRVRHYFAGRPLPY